MVTLYNMLDSLGLAGENNVIKTSMWVISNCRYRETSKDFYLPNKKDSDNHQLGAEYVPVMYSYLRTLEENFPMCKEF